MRRWLLLGIGLLFIQSCSGSESYSIMIEFPVPAADSKAATKTLRVYSLLLVGDGASCQSLQDGITLPEDSLYQIEKDISISNPFTDSIDSIKVNKKETKTRVFFSQAEDVNGIVIFRGCTTVEPGAAEHQVVISLYNTNTYVVTFDGDGATVEAIPTTKTVTLPATTMDALPTEPTKAGYIFGGWWTQKNGAGTEFTTDTVVAASTIVFAKWIPATCTPETGAEFCSRLGKNCDSFLGNR